MIGADVNRIKVGIVGTNFIADWFIQGTSMVSGFEIAAVSANTQASVNRFAQNHTIPYKTTNYHDLAEDCLVDMVYIATPNHLHYEMSMYFLEKKISVFCEKPLAANARQVADMIAASRKNRTLLFNGIVPLYSENYAMLKGYFKKIAPLRRAVFSYGQYSSRYDAYLRGENPPTFRNEFANGSLMDMGVYSVSVAIGLFGKPLKVQARSSKLSNGTDCLGSAILSYDNFEVVILHSKVSNTAILSEIQGEKGIIFLHPMNRLEKIYLQLGKQERKQLGKTGKEGFLYELREFKKTFKAGKIEPDMVPHHLSQDIADVMFEMRQQSDIHFPCYGE